MPASNVTVEALYESASGSVRFDTDAFVYNSFGFPDSYLKFNKDYTYINWGDVPVSFAEGETAEIVAVCDDEHYIENVKAFEEGTGVEIPVSQSGNVYSLTVGTKGIVVVPEFTELGGQKSAKLQDRSPSGQGVFFAGSDGQSLNSGQEVFNTGDTVTLNLIDNSVFDAISITASNGTELDPPVKLQHHTDSKTVTFTMPDRNILIDVFAYYAKFAKISNGIGSFDANSTVTQRSFKPGDKVTFYLSLAYKTCISELNITAQGSTEPLPYKFESAPVLKDNRWESSYSFVMPENDATVNIVTAGCVMAEIDANSCVNGKDGKPVAYIELQHFQGPYFYYYEPYYSTDPLLLPLGERTIRGRYVFDEQHKPEGITVKGKQSGKVYVNRTSWDGGEMFNLTISQTLTEDVIVTPVFEGANEPFEPTTAAPTTVAPTTAVPTTVEPTTAVPTTVAPTTAEPTTVAPTTAEPTTVAPTTAVPTTVEPTTVESTTVESTTVEPTTVEPTTKPDASARGIQTYQDLCDFRDAVNSGNNTRSEYLAGNIIVPEGSEWTQGIGTAAMPYSGTFDGKGFCIIGLRMNNSKCEALFDYIGNGGVVKDLMVFNSRSVISANHAGGIAAFNEGTIDHCTSGINFTGSKAFTFPNGKTVSASDYNSYILGDNAGGVAAVNNGTITGTRNGSVVEGVICGGIAATNDKKIFGCANNGAVGSTASSCKTAGGIAGVNNGKISASYNSGHPSCGDSTKQGMIVGDNYYAAIKDVYYADIDKIPAVGTSSKAKYSDTSGLMGTNDMKKPAFVNTLNEATKSDKTITWVQTAYQNTYFNNGFPTIQGRYLSQRTLALADNLSISSLMHKNLKFDLQPLSSESEDYAKLAAKGNIIAAYSANTTDGNGNYIPPELWTAGGIKLSIPTGGKSICLTAINSDGSVLTISPDSVANGTATFTVADLGSFAVTEAKPSVDASSSTKDSAGNSTGKTSTNGTGSTVAGGAVQTGEPFYAGILLALLSAILILAYFRRRKFENQ